MITIGLNVFFLYGDDLKTGTVEAIVNEQTRQGIKPVQFKIKTDLCIYTVNANRVAASLEGVFRYVFEDYQATAKRIKGKTGTVPKAIKWDDVFTAQNTKS